MATDFKLIVYVNSDVNPASRDICGPGEPAASFSPFAPVWKASGYQWAVQSTNGWQLWGAPDLEINPKTWTAGNLWFEVWDTNPNASIGEGTPIVYPVQLMQFAYAVSNTNLTASELSTTPDFPANKPTLYLANIPAANLPQLYVGSFTMATMIGTASPGTEPTTTLSSQCAVWPNIASAAISTPTVVTKMKVVVFVQIAYTSGNATQVVNFVCDPEMILDTI